MKYKTILNFIIITIINQYSFGQLVDSKYSLIYEFSYKTDTSDHKYASIPEEMILYRVNNISRFLPLNRYYNDSISSFLREEVNSQIINNEEDLQRIADKIATSGLKRKSVKSFIDIRKDFNTNIVLMNLSSIFVFQTYFEERLHLKWILTENIDTIMGLTCFEAITNYGGRKYNAWFSNDIPINDGPYVFHGLPGLIVRVIDSQNRYRFNLKSFNVEDRKVYFKDLGYDPKIIKPLDRKTMVDKLHEFMKSPKRTVLIDESEEQKLKYKERYKKRYDLLMEKL